MSVVQGSLGAGLPRLLPLWQTRSGYFCGLAELILYRYSYGAEELRDCEEFRLRLRSSVSVPSVQVERE